MSTSPPPNKLTNNNDILGDFKVEYFRNLDYQYWLSKITEIQNRFKKTKDISKRNYLVLDLLTTYLQSSEILYIAISTLLKGDPRLFPNAIFIKSDILRAFVEDNLVKDSAFASWFMESIILKSSVDTPGYQEILALYKNVLKECAKDYVDHYELLNAYKHGYRINAKHEDSDFNIQLNGGNVFQLTNTDSTIHYYSKKDGDIIRHQYSYKIERVFGKCTYIVVLLQNLRAIMLVSMGVQDEKHLLTFAIKDRKDWSNSIGQFAMSMPLFTVQRRVNK